MIVFAVLCFFAGLPMPASGQDSQALREGIEQYNQENYEEAILPLTRARTEAPLSAEAAFYLGMAFRQINDLPNAYRQFEDSVNLKPLSDNAILEFIEVSTLVGRLDVAKKWIAVAEEHKVYPARVAFLKGVTLAREEKYDAAIAAFENAKRIEPAYAQPADLQIGVCYLNQRKYVLARDRFQAAVTKDPLSDMASYARRYQEAA
jgi:tetratricopeptide (TPR) repeat protein